jgi:chromosome segregation ATPase
MAEKPKPGPRIKSYDAALDKAIERADTAERRATEAERRLQELEQDTFARNYEKFEGPPTHKHHTTFEKKDQLTRDLQARLEKHEVTIAKKKGEVSAHIAYKKELKASLDEKDKDIKVLKARQDTLTMAIIGRDADIAEKQKIIAALQQQLDDQNTTTSEETDGSKTLKTTHEDCNDAAREKDADIQSLKAMHEGCDGAIESLNVEIKSLAAQAKIDQRSLAQKVILCIALPA